MRSMKKTKRNDEDIMLIIGMMNDFVPFYLFNIMKNELMSEMYRRNYKKSGTKTKRDAATSRKAKRKA